MTSAAKDQMAEIEQIGRRLPGRRTGDFAFVGATLIDGTGAQPVANAVVLTHAGTIVAARPASSIKIPSREVRLR